MTYYLLSILAVDGTTKWRFVSTKKTVVREFLEKHDHEGSSVKLVIHLNDPDALYKFLKGDS